MKRVETILYLMQHGWGLREAVALTAPPLPADFWCYRCYAWMPLEHIHVEELPGH